MSKSSISSLGLLRLRLAEERLRLVTDLHLDGRLLSSLPPLLLLFCDYTGLSALDLGLLNRLTELCYLLLASDFPPETVGKVRIPFVIVKKPHPLTFERDRFYLLYNMISFCKFYELLCFEALPLLKLLVENCLLSMRFSINIYYCLLTLFSLYHTSLRDSVNLRSSSLVGTAILLLIILRCYLYGCGGETDLDFG